MRKESREAGAEGLRLVGRRPRLGAHSVLPLAAAARWLSAHAMYAHSGVLAARAEELAVASGPLQLLNKQA